MKTARHRQGASPVPGGAAVRLWNEVTFVIGSPKAGWVAVVP